MNLSTYLIKATITVAKAAVIAFGSFALVNTLFYGLHYALTDQAMQSMTFKHGVFTYNGEVVGMELGTASANLFLALVFLGYVAYAGRREYLSAQGAAGRAGE